MPSTKKDKIEFQIIGVEILDMNLQAPNSVPDVDVVFNFRIFNEHKVDIDHNQIFVIVTIDVTGNDNKCKYASFKVSCIYNVSEILKFVDSKTKKYNFPDSFVTALNSISYSTARGVMFSQFKGTFLHNAVLPIIDPSQFQLVPKVK